jgi:hypothetical protein
MFPSALEWLPGPRRWARIFVTKFYARQIRGKCLTIEDLIIRAGRLPGGALPIRGKCLTIEDLIIRAGRLPGGALPYAPHIRFSTKDPRDMRKPGVRVWLEKASNAISRSGEWYRAWKAATAAVAAKPGYNIPRYEIVWAPNTRFMRYPSTPATWPLEPER